MPSSLLTTGGLTNRNSFSPRGAPLSSMSVNVRLRQPLGQLARVGDGRRRTDEDRVGPVVPADPLQPSQHVGQMAAEHAAIGVELVDDDEAQVLEQLRPLRMVRQDPRMQHVGVAQHDVRARADRPARVLRRVAVVGEDADVGLGRLVHMRRQFVELGQLVLRQRLGRKQVDRARGRVRQDRAQDRRVVAQGLARGRRRGDDDVVAAEGMGQRGGLMRVELRDAARFERRPQSRVHQFGPGRVPRVDGGQCADRRHPAVGVVGGRNCPPGAESLERGGERLFARGAGGLPDEGRGSRPRQLRRHGQDGNTKEKRKWTSDE